MFDSNEEPMFDDHEFFDSYVEKITTKMKRKSIFYEIPYWEHLKFFHLLDPMYIFKKNICMGSSKWIILISSQYGIS